MLLVAASVSTSSNYIVPDEMSNAQLFDRNICTFCKSSKTGLSAIM
jgi:hypothetical protein